MSKNYYRPIVSNLFSSNEGAFRLSGGWAFFDKVEVINRNEKSKIICAKEIPHEALEELTVKRPNLLNFSFSAPHVMGILNITPDSFSDGGLFVDTDVALNEVHKMIDCGVSILDIGGESTRPGAETLRPAEEIERILPVINKIRTLNSTIPISIDTRKSEVWRISKEAGANMLNDISGMNYDKCMAGIVKKTNSPLCIMHSRGTPQNMKDHAHYENILLDVYDYLENTINKCMMAGIPKKNIIIDPGIGFAKTLEHNLTILRGLSIFHGLGCPILLGASRKKFIGTIALEKNPLKLGSGSVTVALEAINQGVQMLRVHDVFETMQALRLWKSLRVGEE